MHPMIKPALRRGWRDRQTVQFGIAPAHSVVLGPVDDTTASLLDLMDGTRSTDRLKEHATALGLAPEEVDRLTRRLTAAGVLDDATAHRRAAASVPDRLRPDLATLSAVHREPGAGIRRLTTRRSAAVQIRGAGRVGSAIATALAAAGVGHVDVLDGGHVEPWDTLPGGIPADGVGSRRDTAARTVVSRAKPWRDRSRARVHLVIIAPRDGLDAYAPDPRATERFVLAGTPHLFSGVVEGTGVVGPLVLPGRSPCAECLARRGCERDPSWGLVVGQWRSPARRRAGVPACDAALATMVAGVTAAYALNFLDGDGNSGAGYRLRYALPHLISETDRFAAHPECPCGAGAPPATPAEEQPDAPVLGAPAPTPHNGRGDDARGPVRPGRQGVGEAHV
ncbi:ThiF family adenylyltransferase [Streptomyces sp. AJS327]|uniref:ThiF family adenylyltransferase n=1 Tax=Streptomyces sp. AJS327 TaxID=2545265 RepID=UPI0015DEBE26|nr:ThiF family adenylyltransferase [Streptomyces sp. AJS327]MBA0051476.1 ThiF family adenylyltransferase [Streptomyces sp. AJS327]